MTKPLKDHPVGDLFDGHLIIQDTRDDVAANGAKYRVLQLGDKTDTLEARIWNISADEQEKLVTGTVVKVYAAVNEYAGKRQLRPESVVATTLPPDDYVKTAPLPTSEMKRRIQDAINGIQDADIERVVTYLVHKYRDELYVHPAAKRLHHAYRGGLAHHVVGMLDLADTFATLYPTLDRDLLVAGVILHDLGKIHEYTGGGVATDITLEGRLLGHIHIMQGVLAEACDTVSADKETATLLQHMLVSHHGKPEWGSATRPLIAEAEMLHYIDMIDAKMHMLDDALQKTPAKGFTGRLFGLDNRDFYHHGRVHRVGGDNA